MPLVTFSRMIVIQKEVTDEGEEIPFQLTDLECGTEVDGENDRVFLLWPVTIGHKVRFAITFLQFLEVFRAAIQ